MKVLGYYKAHLLKDFAIEEIEVPIPTLTADDVLVQVKAISVNPVDFKIRATRSAQNDRPVILGWDGAGVIQQIGKNVQGFEIGDEVYYAGNVLKEGSNAELQAIDYRIIAKKPKNITFTQAAAMPLTALTAWEALLERNYFTYTSQTHVLIIGGAGGVGSMAIQLLKAKTPAIVIATASREETIAWCKKMGADKVIDHSKDIINELVKLDIPQLDLAFSTNHSAHYIKPLAKLLRPFGHFCLIDDLEGVDISAFKQKCLSLHWEYMFAKTMFNYNIASQGQILKQLCELVESKKVIPTDNLVLEGFSASNLKKAHELLESGTSIGKIVINFR